jgi:hypothetical protein
LRKLILENMMKLKLNDLENKIKDLEKYLVANVSTLEKEIL